MKITMKMDSSKFNAKMKQLLIATAKGSHELVSEYAEELYGATLLEVPKDTNTLASSAYKEVEKGIFSSKGLVGYGGNGDPINPKTGSQASSYMTIVHEDLSANHPNGGKAKYLEDPARRIQDRYVNRKVPGLLSKLAAWYNRR